jgi:ribonuclease-3
MTNSRTLLGHAFSNGELLEQALTHRSAGRRNNERLEFLGDALLNLIVAEYVYEAYPRASEGEMTRLRAALVNGSALADLAREEVLGDRLVLGPGELKTGGFRRESILADTLEALIAAIYLDAGWEACRTLVRRLFGSRVLDAESRLAKDPKTSLQELLQANALALPVYEPIATHGDDHEKTFEVACSIASLDLRSLGSGSSRRAAEQAAAEAILESVRACIAGRRKPGAARP